MSPTMFEVDPEIARRIVRALMDGASEPTPDTRTDEEKALDDQMVNALIDPILRNAEAFSAAEKGLQEVREGLAMIIARRGADELLFKTMGKVDNGSAVLEALRRLAKASIEDGTYTGEYAPKPTFDDPDERADLTD